MATASKYAEYHACVVEACVELMGEHNREFFDKQCSYEDEFKAGKDPADVAREQWESLT